MGLFGNKKEKIVDWSEGYKMPKKRIPSRSSDSSSNIGFLGNLANSNSDSSEEVSWDNDSPVQEDYKEKKTKLAKRLLEMTGKIEDLSNQIYHLKQRIELLEKKLKISFE